MENRTVLYLHDKYVTSLKELRMVVKYMLAPNTDVRTAERVFDEIETTFKDGLIQTWLEAGNDECRAKATELQEIPRTIDSFELKKMLGRIFTDEEVNVERNLSDYLAISEISFVPKGGDPIKVAKNSIEYDSQNDIEAQLVFRFKVRKAARETFRFRIKFEETVAGADEIDLRQYKEGEDVEIGFPKIKIPVGVKSGNFNLSEHGNIVYAAKFVRSSDKKFTVGQASFTMKRVEGGTFLMGSPDNDSVAIDWEKPQHQVTLSDYYIGETVVTQALWKAVMGGNPSSWKGDNLPVENVSWNDCVKFVKKLNNVLGANFSLPTEAQWEYAARGGKNGKGCKYAGSNNINDVAWYDGNSGSKTHPVKSKQANELGLYDMSGNVWEWCQDRFGSYVGSSQTDPTGAASGSYRVLRGGSWSYDAQYCRVAARDYSRPDNGNNGIGFRLVLVQQ